MMILHFRYVKKNKVSSLPWPRCQVKGTKGWRERGEAHLRSGETAGHWVLRCFHISHVYTCMYIYNIYIYIHTCVYIYIYMEVSKVIEIPIMGTPNHPKYWTNGDLGILPLKNLHMGCFFRDEKHHLKWWWNTCWLKMWCFYIYILYIYIYTCRRNIRNLSHPFTLPMISQKGFFLAFCLRLHQQVGNCSSLVFFWTKTSWGPRWENEYGNDTTPFPHF